MSTWSAPAEIVLPGATRYALTTASETWDVQVWVPEQGATSALYVLDPFATFVTAATTAATLCTLSGGLLVPPAVVGVSPKGTFNETYARRFRDMTPTPNLLPHHAPAATDGVGEGDAFLSVLVDEIAPFVESQHGLAPEGRGISGWSLGGLLACHAILSRPDDFDRVLACSPSLWWDDEVLVARAAEARSLAGKRIYVGTAELENDVARMWPPIPDELHDQAEEMLTLSDMVGSATRFAQALEGSGATVIQEVIPDEHHASVWGAASTRGLVALYA